jgi:hypothetical protein
MKFKYANHKKDKIRKSQIRKFALKFKYANHKKDRIRKSKSAKSANLRICDLRNLFADRPTLHDVCQSDA